MMKAFLHGLMLGSCRAAAGFRFLLRDEPPHVPRARAFQRQKNGMMFEAECSASLLLRYFRLFE
ncbi:UNVERIFIED_ORG: hypothetical protein BDK47_10822 [Anoxybacillus amylolyticus]